MTINRRKALKILTLGGVATGSALSIEQTSATVNNDESTIQRIRRTSELRLSIIAGEAPFFIKDITSGKWKGAGILMAEDIARALNAKLTIIEGNYTTSIADLQTGKADLAFPFNQSPQRALAVRFTDTLYSQGIVYLSEKNGLGKSWAELNKPEIKLATIIGGLADTLAKRYCPDAQITAYKTRDDAIVASQTGRVDAFVLAMIQGLGVRAKFPALKNITELQEPTLKLQSSLAIPKDTDYEWRDFLNAWIQSVRGNRQSAEWILQGFEEMGLINKNIPAELKEQL